MTQHGTCTSIYNQVNKRYATNASKTSGSTKHQAINSVWTSKNTESSSKTFENVVLAVTTLGTFAAPILSFLKDRQNNAEQNNDKTQVKDQNVNQNANEANTSASDLNKAVSECKKNGQVAELKAKTENDMTAQQAQAAEIEQMTVQPQANFDKANGEFEKLNQDTTDAKKDLSGLKETEAKATEDATEANNTCTVAQTTYDAASKNLQAAQTAYDSAPAEGKAAAQVSLNAAKTAEAKAKQELQKAQENKIAKNKAQATASKNRSEKETAVNELVKKLSEKKNVVNQLKTVLTEAKANQTKARTANQKWAQAIQQAQATLTEYGETATAKKNETTGDKTLADNTFGLKRNSFNLVG